MKRVIWMILALALLLALYCGAAQAATVASGTCGDSATWTLDDAGNLVISGTGEIGNGGWDKNSVLSVTVGEGITGLQGNPFSQMPYLENAVLPESLKTMDSALFWQDRNLKNVQLPHNVDSWNTRWAFFGCEKLESAAVPEGVTVLDELFMDGCEALASVTLPSTLTAIGEAAFKDCKPLEEVTVPEGVTSIGRDAFDGCISLENISLPSTLKSIDSGAFKGCAFQEIEIPDGVESIITPFYSCHSLKRLIIPESVTYLGSGWLGTGLTSLEYVEIRCSLDGYTIPEWFYDDCPALRQIIISDGPTSIGDYAFRNLTALESITLPSTLTDIGDYAFQNCTSLETIDLPASVTDIGAYAFQNCTNLGAITLPESLEYVGGGAFQGCANLTLTNGMPEKLRYIRGHAFDDCTSLTNVTFPKDITLFLDEYAFANCTGLTDVVLPEKIYTVISDSGIFMNCTSLAHVTLPVAVNETSSNGESMFSGCTSLTSINIPLYIKAGNVVPAEYCKDCTSLVSARLAPGTETIKASAFSGCTSLQSITVPAELTVVEDGAFDGCSALTDVNFGGTAEQWNAIVASFPAGVTVHYVDNYQPFLGVIVAPCEHGTVTTAWQGSAGASFNNTVKITVTPDTGYQLKSLTVTDPHGGKVDASWQRSMFWFEHIYEYVTVTAVFEPESGGGTEANPRQITAADLPTALYSGWYAVAENVTCYTTVIIRGDVHLILNAGATLRARKGVNVSEGNSLTVSGSGTLNASYGSAQAGIGGGYPGNTGAITINSGTIIAAGSSNAAGIGGSQGHCGTITINGGTITATSTGGAPAIGTGTSGIGGTIIINGGHVTASSPVAASHTGSGDDLLYRSSAGIGGSVTTGATIIINGGVIHATGGPQAAAIGSGSRAEEGSSSITIADGLKVTVKGADAPALAADRVSACAEREVTVAPCGHEDDVVLSAAGETSCAHCGTACPVPSFGSGIASDPWKISSAGRWNAVASAIENGLVTSGKYFSLTKNISVTTMMGLANRPFSGVFDGNGKTLTFNMEDHPEIAAPFRYTSSATIRNLHVTGSITGTNQRAAGLIGENSGTTTVTNCRVSATLSGSRLIGGFCIGTGNNLSITGCVFDGKITGNPDQSGCFVAWGTSGLSITDSIAAPKSGSTFTGGTFCHEGSAPTLTNCYYLTAFETVQGRQARTIDFAKGVTADFGTSSAAYSVSGITVYPAGLKYGSKFCAGAGDSVTMSLSCNVPEGSVLLRYDSDHGALTEINGAWTLTMPDTDVVISAAIAPVFGTPDFTLPAAITTVEEEAFLSAGMSVVLVPVTCTSIGARAFKDCGSLWQIQIPAGCAIGTDAFDGCAKVYVYSTAGSPAETYCQGHENCVFVEE